VDGIGFVAVACVIVQSASVPEPDEKETLTVIAPVPEVNAVIAPVIQFVEGAMLSVILTH
jgi:hypothetical protein